MSFFLLLVADVSWSNSIYNDLFGDNNAARLAKDALVAVEMWYRDERGQRFFSPLVRAAADAQTDVFPAMSFCHLAEFVIPWRRVGYTVMSVGFVDQSVVVLVCLWTSHKPCGLRQRCATRTNPLKIEMCQINCVESWFFPRDNISQVKLPVHFWWEDPKDSRGFTTCTLCLKMKVHYLGFYQRVASATCFTPHTISICTLVCYRRSTVSVHFLVNWQNVF